MQMRDALVRHCWLWIAAAVFCVVGIGRQHSAATAAPLDTVEELREILRASVTAPADRDRAIGQQLRALAGINDLRQAVGLREWRDQDPDEQIAAIDRKHRGTVTRVFEYAVRDMLNNGNAASRLAVMDMLVRMTTSTRAVGASTSLVHTFGPDLAELTKAGDLLTREAAARALGQVNPDPAVAIPALASLLDSKEIRLRLAGADGLTCLMRVAAFLATRNRAPNIVEATRQDVVKLGQEVIPVAARGLRDAEPQVRKRSAQAFAQAAEALRKLVPAAHPNEAEDVVEYQRQLNKDCTEILPLLETLRSQTALLTRGLRDSDAQVRVLARQALEDMTSPQMAFLEQASATSSGQSKYIPAASQADAAPAGMRGTVQKLAEGLNDTDARSRRAVIDVLETLGAAAAPAAPALVKALSDKDAFVRWSAARTLGKISPASADTAVPALAVMLTDLDLDLRMAAAAALERYGRAARGVVPDLIQSLRATDAELRVAVIHALGAIGSPEANRALPALTAAVSDPDARVQQAAAEVLGDLGPAARDAVEPLRKALQTGAPKVQKAASEALLKIMRPAR